MLPPVIVNISRLHRETAAVVLEAERSDRPVFVTQHAYVTAVLLPRDLYDRLLRAAEKWTTAATGRARAGADDRNELGSTGSGESISSSLESPLAVFGLCLRGRGS